jgi:hypothetical protein
MQLLEEG